MQRISEDFLKTLILMVLSQTLCSYRGLSEVRESNFYTHIWIIK